MTRPRPHRYRCELFARVAFAGQGPFAVRLLELSEGGAFVEDAEALEQVHVGNHAELSMALPGGEMWVAGITVTRFGRSRVDLRHPEVDHVTVSAVGFGVAFDQLPDDELDRLRDYLELLDAL